MRILRWLALALAPLALWATPAAAQYVVRDGNGVERTFCSFTVLGVHYGCQVLHGSNAGVPQALAVDGSGRITVLQGGSWSVGLSGTLPAFASTPTVNLGTLNGAATAANQATANTSLSSIDGKLNSVATQTSMAAAVTELQGLRTDLATPADSLPPRAPAAKGDATFVRGGANIAAATDTALISATASQTGRLHEIFCTIDGAQTLTFKDGASAFTGGGPFRFPSGGGVLQWAFLEHAYFATSANTALNLTTSTSANVNCRFLTKKD